MRALLFLLALVSLAFAQPSTPDLLWTHQGIEDINAFAWLPDVDGDGVPDVVIETYDAGADGDHLRLVSGGASGAAPIIWSVRPESGASNGGGDGQECLISCDDLNGDGRRDLLLSTVCSASRAPARWPASSSGPATPAPATTPPPSSTTSPAMA